LLQDSKNNTHFSFDFISVRLSNHLEIKPIINPEIKLTTAFKIKSTLGSIATGPGCMITPAAVVDKVDIIAESGTKVANFISILFGQYANIKILFGFPNNKILII